MFLYLAGLMHLYINFCQCSKVVHTSNQPVHEVCVSASEFVELSCSFVADEVGYTCNTD